MADTNQAQDKRVRIELTEEQQKSIKALTGKDVKVVEIGKSIIQKGGSQATIIC
ncbi:hypothetical protein WME76_06905 [Sorangium sp. So ce119]|uniref:hypothetical protein n=1 Tax=Sorangium sp. So ce119 TaxID=3133279 RepID=UPI003F63C85D